MAGASRRRLIRADAHNNNGDGHANNNGTVGTTGASGGSNNINAVTASNSIRRVNRNSRRLEISSRNSSSPTRTIIKILILFGVILSVLILISLYIGNYDVTEIEFNTNMTVPNTASETLRKCIEVCNDILLYELQITTFLSGEPMSNVMAKELRPVQERIASIKTQTSQYEKMEHISGGPTFFISSSLQELDNIEENLLGTLDQKVQQILNDEGRLAAATLEAGQKVFENGLFIVDVALESAKLVNRDIHLAPVIDVGDKVIEDLMTKITLDEVMESISTLIPMLEREEEYFQMLEEFKVKMNLESWEDLIDLAEIEDDLDQYIEYHSELKDAFEEYEMWSDIVREETERNFLLYQLLIPLKAERTERIANLQEQLLDFAQNKRRVYLNLRSDIREDMKKLRIRIQNLRYKYAKIIAPADL